MKLTIHIVNYRSRHYLRECLFSIQENIPPEISVEIIVVNNDEEALDNSEFGLSAAIPLRKIELQKNVGFGKAHNIAFRDSRGKYILFLNPDTKILPGAIEKMLSLFSGDEKLGIASPLLVDSAGKVQPDSFGKKRTPLSTIWEKIFAPVEKFLASGGDIFEVDWVSGGAMFARRDIFGALGGFDENFFMYFEDVDFCLRAKKAGSKVAAARSARIFHESGKSFESERKKKKYYYASQDYYLKKHFGPIRAGVLKLLRLPYYVKNVWLK